MKIKALAAAAALMLLPSAGHAEHQDGMKENGAAGFHRASTVSPRVNWFHRSIRRGHRKATHVRTLRADHRSGKIRHARRGRSGGGSTTSLAGIVAPQLVSKAQEIVRDCGSEIVSARAGRANRSNHPIGRAVDISGNPGCIYAHLHGWPGGYSIDYATAPGGHHVHISYNPGGQEWGVRFAHRHGWARGTRYARHHRRQRIRYARVAHYR